MFGARQNLKPTLLCMLVSAIFFNVLFAQDPPAPPDVVTAKDLKTLDDAAKASSDTVKKMSEFLDAVRDYHDKQKVYAGARTKLEARAPQAIKAFQGLQKSNLDEPDAATVAAFVQLMVVANKIDAETKFTTSREAAEASFNEVWNKKKNLAGDLEKVRVVIQWLDDLDKPEETPVAEESTTDEVDVALHFAPAPPPLVETAVTRRAVDGQDPFAFAPPHVTDLEAASEGRSAPAPEAGENVNGRRPPESRAPSGVDARAGAGREAAKQAGVVRDFRFDAPAHFPQSKFGPQGELIEREGVVIYEGMQFAILQDGRYRVRFTMGTPPMPVTLRLQFGVQDRLGAHYTVTLPPLTFPKPHQPEETTTSIKDVDPVYARTIVVHHEGFLPALKANFAEISDIRRRGTARFGFGVDVP